MAWRAAATSTGVRALLGVCPRGGSSSAACSVAATVPPLAAPDRRCAACARAAGASSGAARHLGNHSRRGSSRCGSSTARLGGSAAHRRQLSGAARAAAAVAPEAAPAAGAAAEQPHVSVLLDEVLKAFEGLQVRCYVDGTLGAGGHASAVLRAHPEMSALVGFDLDPTAHALASARLAAAGAALAPVAVTPAGVASLGAALPATVSAVQQQQQQQPTAFLVRSNFGRMKQVLRQLPLDGASGSGSSSSDGSGGGSASGSEGVDAILLDLGISSMQVQFVPGRVFGRRAGPRGFGAAPAAAASCAPSTPWHARGRGAGRTPAVHCALTVVYPLPLQVDTADRGFSFLRDGPLDMRMDPGAVLSAELAVNSWSEAEIGRVIKEYGEERHWRGIACRCARTGGGCLAGMAARRQRHPARKLAASSLRTQRCGARPCPALLTGTFCIPLSAGLWRHERKPPSPPRSSSSPPSATPAAAGGAAAAAAAAGGTPSSSTRPPAPSRRCASPSMASCRASRRSARGARLSVGKRASCGA